MADFVEDARAEGFQLGFQQGMGKGEIRRAISDLSLLLESRFGTLPKELAARIVRADLPMLDRWFATAIHATSLNEAFKTRPAKGA